MRKVGTVAIIGSPNVGKSTIFNRIVGERKSIIDDEPGVTRDRIYATSEWLGVHFSLIDTGGIELKKRPFQEQIKAQAEIAITEADVIIFVVDGQMGLVSDDKYVAKLLYKCGKPVILAVNKIDNTESMANIHEFYSLGLGTPIAVSGAHGIGIGDVLDEIIKKLPRVEEVPEIDALSFCVIGRPNVGKSSLVNAILGNERAIVSEIEGTTRDSTDSYFKRNGKLYCVVDTAGIKKRGQIYESIDKYALLRAMEAIDRSTLAILMIDGSEGIKEQDKHVLSYAMEKNKGIIIAVNKWDLVVKDQYTMDLFTKKLREEFKFVDYAPIVYLSALKGTRIHTLFEMLDKAFDAYNRRIQTSILNEVIQQAQILNEAPDFHGGRCKIYFAQQVSVQPPTIVLFVNDPLWMHFSYKRYIENKLRSTFDFDATPINIILRKKS
ncbi:MAG: ribosome biogenesis GTPase Der [Bacilli bacterium]